MRATVQKLKTELSNKRHFVVDGYRCGHDLVQIDVRGMFYTAARYGTERCLFEEYCLFCFFDETN
jgi:hypothetical protein